MSDSWPITEEGTVSIRQNTNFNLKQLYKTFHDFSEEYKYKFNEKNFTRKDKSDGSEYQIEWAFERKVTQFIKFKIDVEIWSLRTTEEKGLFRGDLEMNFNAVMEMDYENKWEKNTLAKLLRKIYIYYLKKPYFLKYAGKLWMEIYDLHARAKTTLIQFPLS